MSLNLVKETEAARLVLTKRQAPQIKAQMNMVFDVSGSMRSLYGNGVVSNVIQRLLALATVVDPDGSIETVAFSNRACNGATLQAGEFDRAQETFLNSCDDVLWGGTDYASGLICLLNQGAPKPKKRGFFSNLFGGAAPKEEPKPAEKSLVFFITDGSNDHGNDAEFLDLLQNNKDVYFTLVGVGYRGNFGLLRRAAEDFDNVGLIEATNFKDLDADFYSMVMTDELVRWYQA